jgi:hypothetical protein
MTKSPLFRYAGWSAYVSAAATVVVFVTAILFFAGGGPFGILNDISSVFQVLFMLPVALALYQLLRPSAQFLNTVALATGIVGMLVSGFGQSLLVFGIITYQQSLLFFPAGAAIGIWLVLANVQALSSELLPRGLAWAGVLSGASYILTVAGFLLGGQQSPFFYMGGLVLVIAYPIWAIWLGRMLLSDKLVEATETMHVSAT